MFHPTLKIKIYQEDLVFGPGLVILMEHILVTESMKDACGEMGMSYSKGWKIINRAEKELGYELLERRHGGKSGGKCTVTEKGKSLMKRYRQMEEETRDCLQKSFEKYFPEYQRIREIFLSFRSIIKNRSQNKTVSRKWRKKDAELDKRTAEKQCKDEFL